MVIVQVFVFVRATQAQHHRVRMVDIVRVAAQEDITRTVVLLEVLTLVADRMAVVAQARASSAQVTSARDPMALVVAVAL